MEKRMNSKRWDTAQIQMIMAMIIFGTIGIFVKKIPLSSGEIALFRAMIATVAIVIYQVLSKRRLSFKNMKADIPILFLSGTAMAFNWILLFQAYNYTSVSIATLSYYFAPVIVMIVSPFLFHEKLSRKQIICFIMATIGLILVININNGESKDNHILGIIFGLGAAILYAMVILLNKKIKTVTGIDRTLFQFIAAIIVLFPYVIATSGIHVTNIGNLGLSYLLILGLVHTGITYCMYFSSVKNLPGQRVAILSYIDPLVAIVVSVVLLSEGISIQQAIGGFIILGFTLWNEL